MKRGQILGQPFIFIFAAIVIAILLFFGVRVIWNATNLGEDLEVEAFFLEIEEEVAEAYNLDYGSRISLNSISVPNTLKEICFMNKDESLSGVTGDKALKLNAAKQNGNNVVLIPEKGKYNNKEIENFRVGENPLCENLLDGELNLVLESMGSYVGVKNE